MTDRASRLSALAARANKVRSTKSNSNDAIAPASDNVQHEDDQPNRPVVKFRNYVPTNTALEQQASTPSDKEETTLETAESQSSHIQKKRRTENSIDLEQALQEAKQDIRTSADNINNSSNPDASVALFGAAQKINMDLKQDIQKKLHRLEKRTQKAIVDLLRERLEKEAQEEENEDDDDGELD